MFLKIRQWLYEPIVRGLHVDDESLLHKHAEVLKKKWLLRSAFETFYFDMVRLCECHFKVDGLEVELGSGAGFFKTIRPSLITSDIRKAPYIDMALDAQNMPLQDNSVRCLYAINVFHHLPNPESFFTELLRVLKSGGGCVLIEPHGGFVSALVHKYLHSDEFFDLNASSWSSEMIQGPLSGANQALADIVFQRDYDIFCQKFGHTIEIVHKGYELNALRYLLSGGLNFRQLLPDWMEPALKKVEALCSSAARYWSLHQVIVIKKKVC